MKQFALFGLLLVPFTLNSMEQSTPPVSTAKNVHSTEEILKKLNKVMELVSTKLDSLIKIQEGNRELFKDMVERGQDNQLLLIWGLRVDPDARFPAPEGKQFVLNHEIESDKLLALLLKHNLLKTVDSPH